MSGPADTFVDCNASHTFIDFNGETQTVAMNNIILADAGVTGRISGLYNRAKDGKKCIRIWWTDCYGSNEFPLDEIFNQKYIDYHHITKTTESNLMLHSSGIDTTADLGRNLGRILTDVANNYKNI